jgi:predicted nucleic acid-binding protein
LQSSRIKGISCLLDTDIVIDFLRKRDYARKLLENWAGEGLLAISALTHLEIYQGMKSGEEKGTNVFLDGLVSVAVDVPVARQAGRIRRYRRCYYRSNGIAPERSFVNQQCGALSVYEIKSGTRSGDIGTEVWEYQTHRRLKIVLVPIWQTIS